MGNVFARWTRWRRMTLLSARQIASRYFYLVPLAPILWFALQFLLLLADSSGQGASEASVVTNFVGLPLSVLGIGLGSRIIASEIDRRTLEIVYTVPGGAQRVWISKLTAALLILIASIIPVGLLTYFVFVAFGFSLVVSSFQAAVVYMLMSMGLGALFRNEITGILASLPLLLLGLMSSTNSFSPFYNPASSVFISATSEEMLANAVQNRIGMVLFSAALIALAFSRADRREKMLSG